MKRSSHPAWTAKTSKKVHCVSTDDQLAAALWEIETAGGLIQEAWVWLTEYERGKIEEGARDNRALVQIVLAYQEATSAD